MGDSATVLIVDDDPQIRMVFAELLQDDCTVVTAGSGTAALEKISDAIDVVLLDRRMVGLSGDDVLESLRERGYTQSIVLVTSTEPDFDILSMGFDDYLVKPVTQAELTEVVEAMLLRKEYDELIREFFALVSKITSLEREKRPGELAANPEFIESKQRLEELREQATEAIDVAVETERFSELFYELPSSSSVQSPNKSS